MHAFRWQDKQISKFVSIITLFLVRNTTPPTNEIKLIDSHYILGVLSVFTAIFGED